MQDTPLPLNLANASDDQLIEMVSTLARRAEQLQAMAAKVEGALDRVLAEIDNRPEPDPTWHAEEIQPLEGDVDYQPTEAEVRADILRQYRMPGETLQQAADRMFRAEQEARYLRAERECRGELLNRLGRALGRSPFGLFQGPASVAAKYASQELIDWWAIPGNERITRAEHMWDWTGAETFRADAETAAGRTRDLIVLSR